METYIKLNSQVAGKDKIARLLQYASRALWHFLKTNKLSPETVGKLKSLEYNFGTFRKLLRFGKSVEVLYQAFSTIHLHDLTVRCSLTMSKIATALFLLSDHILWIGRSGLSTVNISRWADLSNRYWLYSIIMNLVRDVYEIKRIFELHKWNLTSSSTISVVRQKLTEAACVMYSRHTDVLCDTVKNSCDIWIPLTALGYTKLKPGTIGVLGVISSIAGIIALLSPAAKLTPS